MSPTKKTRALETRPADRSVKKAATMLGISARSVYGSVATGRVRQEDVERFELRAPGRLRSLVLPRWRCAPAHHRQFVTTLTIHLRSGMHAALAERLAQMR